MKLCKINNYYFLKFRHLKYYNHVYMKAIKLVVLNYFNISIILKHSTSNSYIYYKINYYYVTCICKITMKMLK